MTSAQLSLLVCLGAVLLFTLAYGGLAIFVLPKLALRRRRKELAAMSGAALAKAACRSAEAAGMRERFAEAALFAPRERWDGPALLVALDDLYRRLDEEDRRTGESGPGSWVYSYYDFGLASIHEAARLR